MLHQLPQRRLHSGRVESRIDDETNRRDEVALRDINTCARDSAKSGGRRSRFGVWNHSQGRGNLQVAGLKDEDESFI